MWDAPFILSKNVTNTGSGDQMLVQVNTSVKPHSPVIFSQE